MGEHEPEVLRNVTDTAANPDGRWTPTGRVPPKRVPPQNPTKADPAAETPDQDATPEGK